MWLAPDDCWRPLGSIVKATGVCQQQSFPVRVISSTEFFEFRIRDFYGLRLDAATCQCRFPLQICNTFSDILRWPESVFVLQSRHLGRPLYDGRFEALLSGCTGKIKRTGGSLILTCGNKDRALSGTYRHISLRNVSIGRSSVINDVSACLGHVTTWLCSRDESRPSETWTRLPGCGMSGLVWLGKGWQ
jgi:hypothetical protein